MISHSRRWLHQHSLQRLYSLLQAWEALEVSRPLPRLNQQEVQPRIHLPRSIRELQALQRQHRLDLEMASEVERPNLLNNNQWPQWEASEACPLIILRLQITILSVHSISAETNPATIAITLQMPLVEDHSNKLVITLELQQISSVN